MKTLSKKEWIALSVALVVVALFFLSKSFIYEFLTSGVSQNTNTGMNDTTMPADSSENMIPESVDALMLKDVEVGTGAEAVPGKMISVHYTGTLTNGTVFDSSLRRNMPFEFTLGAGQVIAGWDQGIVGMKVGGKRSLIIPANMAYGPEGRPPVIPANATLVFDVELLGVN